MSDVERLRAVIAERAGATVRDDDLGSLGVLLDERMRSLGCTSFDEYLVTLQHPDELAALVHRIVAGETYFFRSPAQFRALETIFQRWKRQGRAAPRILSAGCATGEEAYSIAILVQRYWKLADASIIGVDIDPARLALAEAGRYSSWSLRAIDPTLRSTYFRRVGRRYEVVKAIRSSVRFHRWNLVRPVISFGQLDVIFCRNVMIYFDVEAASQLAVQLAAALAPDGYLFTSHAERLDVVGVETRRFDEAFVHARANTSTSRHAPSPASEPVVASPARARRKASSSSAESNQHTEVREEVITLLHRERYREALSVLESVPHRGVRLEEMRAGLLFATGALDDATRLARRLRSSSRVANLVAGLCAEARGDRATAEFEYRLATQGPVCIAVAHMRLGLLLAERDPDAAVRQLRVAREQLAAESVAMVLLFGGGFGVEALQALCTARIERLEETWA